MSGRPPKSRKTRGRSPAKKSRSKSPKKRKTSKKRVSKQARPMSALSYLSDTSTEEETIPTLKRKNEKANLRVKKESEDRNYFQLERDKINALWEVTKRDLEEARAELVLKDKKNAELVDKHDIELKVYKQRIKHLLYEQQCNVTDLKHEGEEALIAEQQQQVVREEEKDKQIKSLKLELNEMELSHEDIVKSLKMEHDKLVTRIRSDYDEKLRSHIAVADHRLVKLREEMDLQRKTEVMEVESRKNAHIHGLMQKHEGAFAELRNYYNDVTKNNMDLIKSLKSDMADMKKKEALSEKTLYDVQQDNKRLLEPLQKATKETGLLRKQLTDYERDKVSLKTARGRIKKLEREKGQLEWEEEVQAQKLDKLQKERDELYDKLVTSVYDLKQKAGFKTLVLEKKLGAQKTELEKKDAQLGEVITAAGLDPVAVQAVTNKLDDVLDAKNKAISALQNEVYRLQKAHNDLLRAYEAKLVEYGIPSAELGFEPMPTITSSVPAGLVTK